MGEKNMFALYDSIIEGIEGEAADELITHAHSGRWWSLCETESTSGIAMTTEGDSISPMLPNGLEGLSLRCAAEAVKSWNLYEASLGMAAANAYYNRLERMESLSCAEPFDNYCTAGLDLRDKRIGLIGHLHMPDCIRKEAKELFTIERNPRDGDYPDAACDFILPRCDCVIITGSSLVNKTLPHLLELCRSAVTILTGPTVPMCPGLLDMGFDRLAGMAVTERDTMRRRVELDMAGSPYPWGRTWLLKK